MQFRRELLGAAALGAGLLGALGGGGRAPAALDGQAPAVVTPADAVALVRAGLVDLSRRAAFRTTRSAPSLRVVTLVEPRRHAERATLRFAGPRGPGTVRSVVAGGVEDLAGDTAGWTDFLIQSGAPPAAVAEAASLAGTWYSTQSAVSFGPTLAGIGHVLCAGARCTLNGAHATQIAPGHVVVALPGLDGTLTLRPGAHPVPLAFTGTGANEGVALRFGYPSAAPAIAPPLRTAPLPPVLAR